MTKAVQDYDDYGYGNGYDYGDEYGYGVGSRKGGFGAERAAGGYPSPKVINGVIELYFNYFVICSFEYISCTYL